MSRSSSLRLRLRVLGLATASVLAAALAGVLLFEPALLGSTHPLPLAGAFALIAVLTLLLANWLRVREL